MRAKTKGAKFKASLGTLNTEYSDASGCSSGSYDRGDLKLSVSRIRMTDYETHHHNKEKLKELARPFGEIKTTSSADLEQVRALIGKLRENNPQNNTDLNQDTDNNERSIKTKEPDLLPTASNDNWCFVDSVTAIRFFRIDRAQVQTIFSY